MHVFYCWLLSSRKQFLLSSVIDIDIKQDTDDGSIQGVIVLSEVMTTLTARIMNTIFIL